jgi:hypothetical protein
MANSRLPTKSSAKVAVAARIASVSKRHVWCGRCFFGTAQIRTTGGHNEKGGKIELAAFLGR